MSLQQSNLAAQGLGYDMVVAISQLGLTEATGDKYDQLPGKELSMYWYYPNGISGNPDDATYAMLNLPGNLNPFTVPAWQTKNGANAHITTLQTAHFAMGVKGTPGIPDSVSFPNIVTLNSDGTVDFTIYFLDVQVVAAIYDASGNITQYLNVSQDDDTPLNIVFRLPFKTISSNNSLPPAVQKALGTTDVTVQQLVLDFGLSPYLAGLNIPGLDQMAAYPSELNNVFGSICLQALADAGITAVGYNVPTENLLPASLAITSLTGRGDMLVDGSGHIITNPSSDQLTINTLNLYCATNGDPLPAPAQLPWNWLDTPADGQSYDGAMAFKYGTIVNYFKGIMDTYVSNNCYQPSVTPDEDYQFFNPVLTGGQKPQTATAYTTYQVLNSPFYGQMLDYGYNSNISKYDYGDGRYMTMWTMFSLNVSFTKETITVTQQLMVHANIDFGMGEISVDFINKIVTDTYTIKVDIKGYLLFDVNSSVQDNNTMASVDYDLVPDYFQGAIYDLSDYANSVASGSFDADPLNQLQKFVFPGGKTFTFSDGQFSNFGDLVAHIKFADNPD